MTDIFSLQGIARTSTLIANGWSPYRLKQGLANGTLIRPRKGWIARADADPALVLAARHALILSCITQATRLGLWTAGERLPHLSVRSAGNGTRPGNAILHWRAPLLPREPDVLTDSIENVLDHVAHCQPFEEAVAIWDSALNKGLAQAHLLERLPLRGASRKVLRHSSRFADSGLESYVRIRLAWLRVRIVAQVWIHGHRVDFLIGDRLVLQIDGGHHVGAQRTSDIRHDAALRLLGYTVLRVGYEQVMHSWPEVQGLVMQAVAQGLHLSA